jgi:hypothetical protein
MAGKRVAAKKKSSVAPVIPTIDVDVDLGPLRATKEQEERLRAHLNSVLLTWIKYDVKEKRERPVIVIDHHGRPVAGDEGDNG